MIIFFFSTPILILFEATPILIFLVNNPYTYLLVRKVKNIKKENHLSSLCWLPQSYPNLEVQSNYKSHPKPKRTPYLNHKLPIQRNSSSSSSSSDSPSSLSLQAFLSTQLCFAKVIWKKLVTLAASCIHVCVCFSIFFPARFLVFKVIFN